jgi:hypothetical protein
MIALMADAAAKEASEDRDEAQEESGVALMRLEASEMDRAYSAGVCDGLANMHKVACERVDALRAEVEAWRVVDRLATGTDAYRKAYDEARRLRAQNEGGERG